MNANASPALGQERNTSQITTKELVDLCALDDGLFAKSFFPQAVRQASPPMHAVVDAELNNPSTRFLNLLLPRDFAKTTKLRLFAAKRVAFGLSRTILYVAASEIKATQNVNWLRNRIGEKMNAQGVFVPPFFSQVFGLKKGTKWTETELEVQHPLLNQAIWILGVGITSESVRGINFDDYRPDLIILDDVLTDENGATKEQRDKITNLVDSAIKNSLAPRADSPNAKLVMLNTPQHSDDITAKAARDPDWKTIRFSCWTPATESLPLNEQESAWPERHPTPSLRLEKSNAVAANRLSAFIREKECRIVARESSMFKPEWLAFYGDTELPPNGLTVLAIDPVPPPTEGMTKQGKVLSSDFEVHTVWRRYGDRFFLLEMAMMRGHQPTWTTSKSFELATRWRVNWFSVEGVAAQKYLKFILEQEMIRRQTWFTINLFSDIRSKPVRINSILATPASMGRIVVRSEHSDFIQQWNEYPNCDHDDILDSAAMGVASLSKPWMDVADEHGIIDNTNVVPMKIRRTCP